MVFQPISGVYTVFSPSKGPRFLRTQNVARQHPPLGIGDLVFEIYTAARALDCQLRNNVHRRSCISLASRTLSEGSSSLYVQPPVDAGLMTELKVLPVGSGKEGCP